MHEKIDHPPVYDEHFYEQYSPAEANVVAEEIIELQKKLKGRVKVRRIDSMARMLENGNVFFVRNNHEIVFSFTLSHFIVVNWEMFLLLVA